MVNRKIYTSSRQGSLFLRRFGSAHGFLLNFSSSLRCKRLSVRGLQSLRARRRKRLSTSRRRHNRRPFGWLVKTSRSAPRQGEEETWVDMRLGTGFLQGPRTIMPSRSLRGALFRAQLAMHVLHCSTHRGDEARLILRVIENQGRLLHNLYSPVPKLQITLGPCNFYSITQILNPRLIKHSKTGIVDLDQRRVRYHPRGSFLLLDQADYYLLVATSTCSTASAPVIDLLRQKFRSKVSARPLATSSTASSLI